MSNFLVCCGQEVGSQLKFSKSVSSLSVLRQIIEELVLDEMTERKDGVPPRSYSTNHLQKDETPHVVKSIYEMEKELQIRAICIRELNSAFSALDSGGGIGITAVRDSSTWKQMSKVMSEAFLQELLLAKTDRAMVGNKLLSFLTSDPPPNHTMLRYCHAAIKSSTENAQDRPVCAASKLCKRIQTSNIESVVQLPTVAPFSLTSNAGGPRGCFFLCPADADLADIPAAAFNRLMCSHLSPSENFAGSTATTPLAVCRVCYQRKSDMVRSPVKSIPLLFGSFLVGFSEAGEAGLLMSPEEVIIATATTI